jgi:peptidoglycan hydrolase-like protein with peptidoglycan-binding domain
MSARQAAEEAAERVLEAIGGAQDQSIIARAQTRSAVPLRQRGRTGNASHFNSSLHPHGQHGRFRSTGGRHPRAQASSVRDPAQIKQFQKQYGLPQTGKLDAATRATMAAPPQQTIGQQAASAARAAAAAEAQKTRESMQKREAKRKIEGKSPSSSSTSSRSGSSSSTSERSALKAAEKIAHDAGNQRLAESLRKQLQQLPSSGASKSASKAAANKITNDITGESWTGQLNVKEDLHAGVGMEAGKPASPAVGLLQSKLQALGYNVGSAGVDGKFGKSTQVAVKVLQREYGLKPDGIVGPQTLQLLETLTERAQRWAKQGIIEAEVLVGESVVAAARAAVNCALA